MLCEMQCHSCMYNVMYNYKNSNEREVNILQEHEAVGRYVVNLVACVQILCNKIYGCLV